jgi:GT2 family glycosyltransferase
MYAEDVEWGCRISSSGYQIYYLPCIEIIHLVGGSGKREEQLSGYSLNWLKNIRLLYQIYNKKQPAAVFNFIFGTGLILRFFLYYLLYLKNRKKEDMEKAKQLVFYAKYLFKN